jgi:hypothetical protein
MAHGTRFLIINWNRNFMPLVFEIEKKIKRNRKSCWK